MREFSYGIGIDTPLGIDEAEVAIRDALAAEGFGILTEIDVAATMKAKLDLDRRPYRILGACNPALASRALAEDEHIGLLLPCNVIVFESGTGTKVEILEPSIMSSLADGDVSAIAAEAREGLVRALDSLDSASAEVL